MSFAWLETWTVASGMQKHKPFFLDPSHIGLLGDVQHCLRLTDLDEVGDGTHWLDFYMLGLFSFRQWSIQQGVDFWMSFLQGIDLMPDTVTIPPHRPQWRELYVDYPVSIRVDPECVWSDGTIGGDCTEFYRQGVEIGNIVNPLGDCLDCGFGLDRLQSMVEGETSRLLLRPDVLERTVGVLLDEGIRPGPGQQGYVLRKLIREQLRVGGHLPQHPYVDDERRRREKLRLVYERLRHRQPTLSPQVLWETYGLHPDDVKSFQSQDC
jgi:alanyl-tRNA synthetase